MKSLRDYTLKLDPGTEHEAITWGAGYTPAYHATVNGLQVRVLNIGERVGASTVYNCADETGFSTAIKQRDVTFTDGAALPLKDEPSTTTR